VDNEQGWRRLAEAVRQRRDERGWTQPDVYSRGGPSIDRIQAIEGVRTDSYSSRTLSKLERALDWKTGSCRAILAGGEATSLEDRGSRPDNTGPVDELLDADADDDGLRDLVDRARRERDAGDPTLYKMLLRLQGPGDPPRQESDTRDNRHSGGAQQVS
jgi:hypothetical protein